MRPDEVGSLIARLEAAFEHDLPSTTQSVYVDELADLDYEAARLGVEALIRTGGRFFPRISEIRQAAVAARSDLPSFGEAWAEMSDAASHAHPTIAPRFSHPAVDELVRQLGWENFRLSDPMDTYYEHAAEERYRAICDRSMRQLVSGAPLPGSRPRELPEGFAALVDGVGDEDA